MERKFPFAGLDFTKALVFKLWPISQSPEGLDCWVAPPEVLIS